MAKTNYFKELTQTAKSSLAIAEYIEGDGLRDALAAIDAAELRAAGKMLEPLEGSQEKRSAISKALARLQIAHDKYKKIHQKASQGWRKDLCMEVMSKDVFACCSIALCHHYLNNGKEAIEGALAEAESAYESSIYLSDHNDRERRLSTAQMDLVIGSFMGRINREDLTDRKTARLCTERGARVTDGLLAVGTFILNAINPFYYQHLGTLRSGQLERIRYGDFAAMKANLMAAYQHE